MMEQAGFTDTPSSEDLLNRDDYVCALKEIVTTCKTPMTISITGEWGSGKTSFVRQLKKKLDKKEIEFVEFNTWEISQFEANDNLKLSLLKSFISEITPDKETEKEFAKIFKKVATVGTNIFFNKVADLDLKEITELTKDENIDDESSIVQDVKRLKKSIEKQISTKNKRYVIFIDDLDRINPENAIEILEFLKLFLSMKNCVYLVAIDEKVIGEGLKSKYKNLDKSFNDTRNYFEKLIQLPFYLPNTLSNDEQVSGYIEKLRKSSSIEKMDLGLISKIVNCSIGGNPRRIKRIMNAYWLLSIIMNGKKASTKASTTASPELLFYIVCFQTHYNDRYSEFEMLINQNTSIDDTIRILNEGIGDEDENLKKFLSILGEDFYKVLSKELLQLILSFSRVNRAEAGNTENLAQSMRDYIPILFESMGKEKLTRIELWKGLTDQFPKLNESPGAFNGLLDRVNKEIGVKVSNQDGKILVRDKTKKKPVYYFV